MCDFYKLCYHDYRMEENHLVHNVSETNDTNLSRATILDQSNAAEGSNSNIGETRNANLTVANDIAIFESKRW